MLDLCLAGHADHIDIIGYLAQDLMDQYDIQGNILYLNRAIEINQKRLYLCPPGHAKHTTALGGYASSLWSLYWTLGNVADLDKAIEMEQKRLDLCPSGHPDHALALKNLAISLESRFRAQGNITDLNKAIEMTQKVLDLCPDDYQDAVAIGNLATALQTRYGKQDNLEDLEKAIELNEKQLTLYPSGHPFHAYALQCLANALKSHYKATKTPSDIIRATKLLQDSVAVCPVHHNDFPFGIQDLAEAILLTLESSDQPDLSLEDAFDAYRLLRGCGPAASINLWDAACAWIQDAEEHEHPSVLEAYQVSLNTLDHLTSTQPSVDTRHEAMQEKVADLASDAFACAISHENHQMAIELLEQGRGILWNQLARFDTSLAALESQGIHERGLANRFTRLSAGLKKHAQGSASEGTDPYWRVHDEWKSVVDEIRLQDGFSRFLLSPRFNDLQRAAECGPVIIVNASEYNCDALIVLCDQPPVHVPLNCSFDDVDELCSQFSELTQDPHAYGRHRESWIKETLRELWSSVVEPIVTVLQNDIQLPTGSRIWWYPTSIFTILPFHAAGTYRTTGKNLMDIYVSSYAPSLSALTRARERARAQRKASDASGNGNVISFAAIGQAQPSANLNLPHLPEVEHEITRVHKQVGEVPNVSFDTVTGAAATIEGAVQAFRDHRWVHIACHGAQHTTKPFESWFAMGDGKLTLMRIIQERYTHSEFAFLSACHTAVGDESTPDEVIHLAAGMQFAGFNGVIGTLWRVDDSMAQQVVTRFYREMFKPPGIDFEYAAAALNAAVVESGDKVPLENRIVFVHIGI